MKKLKSNKKIILILVATIAVAIPVCIFIYFLTEQPRKRYMKESFIAAPAIYAEHSDLFNDVAKIISSKDTTIFLDLSPYGPSIFYPYDKKDYQDFKPDEFFTENEYKRILELMEIEEIREAIGIYKSKDGDVFFDLFAMGGLDFIRLVYLPEEGKYYFDIQRQQLNEDWMLIWSSYPRV